MHALSHSRTYHCKVVFESLFFRFSFTHSLILSLILIRLLKHRKRLYCTFRNHIMCKIIRTRLNRACVSTLFILFFSVALFLSRTLSLPGTKVSFLFATIIFLFCLVSSPHLLLLLLCSSFYFLLICKMERKCVRACVSVQNIEREKE